MSSVRPYVRLSFDDVDNYAAAFILSNMGMIMSKRGRFPGSSFMQILMSLDMCGEIPGGILMRRPSSATFIPISMEESSANGTSLVASSQSSTA